MTRLGDCSGAAPDKTFNPLIPCFTLVFPYAIELKVDRKKDEVVQYHCSEGST